MAWYNIVAIVIGVFFLIFECYWLFKEDEWDSAIYGGCLIPILIFLFYGIWGGIFWW